MVQEYTLSEDDDEVEFLITGLTSRTEVRLETAELVGSTSMTISS
jgi:hypothetical protein